MKNNARNQLKKLVEEVLSEMTDSSAKKSLKDEKTDKMKDVKVKGGNTEMKAASEKSITPKIPNSPSPESKKRPVVEELDPSHFATEDELEKDVKDLKTTQSRAPRAPTAPVAIGESIKKLVLKVIREEIEEYRTKGALGAKNPNRAGPMKQYVPRGNTGMGRPAAEAITTALVKVNGKDLGKFDLNAKLPSGKPDMTPLIKRVRQFVYNDPDMAAYAINPSAIAAFERVSDLELDGKLTQANRLVNLRVQGNELVG